ncbi:MAG: hypothetical protein AAF423_08585 [Pseudomonadota bacterium]
MAEPTSADLRKLIEALYDGNPFGDGNPITGDFDGDGTTETINIGWDRIEALLLAA